METFLSLEVDSFGGFLGLSLLGAGVGGRSGGSSTIVAGSCRGGAEGGKGVGGRALSVRIGSTAQFKDATGSSLR